MVDSYSNIISALSYNRYFIKTVKFIIIVNMSAECIGCQNPVRVRQQGLQCYGCFRWQHRTCGTGISQCDYRFAVQTGASIDWRCATCLSIHREVKLTALQIRLVSDRKLKRIQQRKYRDLQTKLFNLWDEYEANERSAKRLLKACSY